VNGIWAGGGGRDGPPAAYGMAAERSPANEDGTVWAVLEGELYNRERLREELSRRGHRLEGEEDVGLLPHLYEEYGTELVHALDGAFAFAIWDAPRRRLCAARDRLGEASLFYAAGGGRFAVAPGLLPLASGLGLSEPEPLALREYLRRGWIGAGRSALAGALPVPPGHLLIHDPEDGVRTRRYWARPDPARAESESGPELRVELGHLVELAVRSRIGAVSPVVLLDGGIGSALVAALAARDSTVPIATFGADPAARAVAEALGAEHHELRRSPEELAAVALEMLAAFDRPFADPGMIVAGAVAAAARASAPAALGGLGAGRLLGGAPPARVFAPAPESLFGPRLVEAADLPERSGRGADAAAEDLAIAGEAARLASLRLRSPLLQFELVEFAATVPSDPGPGEGRLLRELLGDVLPSLASRPERAASPAPLVDEMMRGPLAEPLRRRIRDGRLTGDGWVSAPAATALLDEHERGIADHGSTLWALLVLGAWLDRCTGGEDG